MIEATQATNEFNFDDSALSRAKETVADLEKRLEVMARKAEMEGRYADDGRAGDRRAGPRRRQGDRRRVRRRRAKGSAAQDRGQEPLIDPIRRRPGPAGRRPRRPDARPAPTPGGPVGRSASR